jgi:hypothetical protein
MKKTIILFSAIVLFAGLTFGQTPKTQDKVTTTPKAQTTQTTTPAKDAKAGCDKKDMEKCAHSKDMKSGCCAHGSKTDVKDTKAPEKK